MTQALMIIGVLLAVAVGTAVVIALWSNVARSEGARPPDADRPEDRGGA